MCIINNAKTFKGFNVSSFTPLNNVFNAKLYNKSKIGSKINVK